MKIILPDTNLLIKLFQAHLSKYKNNRVYKRVLNFWCKENGRIEIPPIVFAEFIGVWFHKQVNFEDYKKWYTDQFDLFMKGYSVLLQNNRYNECEGGNEILKNIFDEKLTNIFLERMMPASLINIIVETLTGSLSDIEKQINRGNNSKYKLAARDRYRGQLENGKGKIVDGLDSLLITFAYEYAKANEDKEVVVASNDRMLVVTMNHFSKIRDKDPLHGYSIPENVSAKFVG